MSTPIKNLMFLCLLVGILLTVLLLTQRKVQADGTAYYYLGQHPGCICISPDGAKLYVAIEENKIAVMDKSGMTIIDEFTFGDGFMDMQIEPGGQYLYLTHPEFSTGGHGPGCISRIRLSDWNLETISLAPATVWHLTFDDTGEYVYVCGGTWPNYNEGFDVGDYENNLNSGRIFEVRTSDFTLTRTLNAGIDNKGISYNNGKIVVMSVEESAMEIIDEGGGCYYEKGPATMCLIIDDTTFDVEHSLPVHEGFYNTSCALPDDNYVMTGFNSPGEEGEGLGLLNVATGEIEHWYITNPPGGNYKEGGGFWMTVDPVNNILYSTFYTRRVPDQSYTRLGIIDLDTNEYTEWLVEPARLYTDITFDPTSGHLYLAAPLDDAIVVLEPPE